jgi:hypothetical protein
MGWKDWLGLASTRDRFARDLARRAAKRGVPGWSWDPAEAALSHAERGQKFFVNNSWLEYCGAQRSARAGLIEKYLSMMLDGPPEVPKLWELAARNLYGCVRSRYQLLSNEIEHRGTTAFVKPVATPWIGDLDIVLMYDFGPYLAQVMPETADVWGQSQDALFARATAGLAALTRPTWQPIGDGVFRIVSEVSFEESFVLVNAVFESLAVQGDAVVAIPNRGVLLATGSDMPAGLARLIAEAQRSMQEEPWPMSAVLLRRTAGRWQPFKPSAELASAARTFELVSLAGTYAEQQQALEKHFEKDGVDIYVAKFDVMNARNEPDTLHSWCSWAEGVPSLLPKTDVVILGRRDENVPPVIASWDVLARICGRYLQPTEEVPPRFRVESFPLAEWEQLVAAGETLAKR